MQARTRWSPPPATPEAIERLRRQGYRGGRPENYLRYRARLLRRRRQRRENESRRRARKGGCTVEAEALILQMLHDLNPQRCVYCGAAWWRRGRLTMDHQLPLKRGGKHSPDNMVPACRRCNTAKGARGNVEAWIRRRWGVRGLRRFFDWSARRYWWLQEHGGQAA